MNSMTWMIEQYVLMEFRNWNSELGSMSGRLISERDWSFFLAGSENIHEQSPACHAAGQTAGAAVPIAVFLLTTVCQHSHSDKPLIFPFHLHLLHHLVPGECAYLMCNDTQVTHCQQSTTVRDIYTSTSPHSHTQIHHWEANVHFHMISGIIWYDNNQALNKKWQGEFWWFFPKK